MKIKKSTLFKFWNFWPPFFFSGIKIVNVSDDYLHVLVRLKLRFWNANYVGTQYGGLMFSMTDPFYMVMLIQNLGQEYIVWDKSACINYLKPGKTDVTAEFTLTNEDLSEIRRALETQSSMDWQRNVEVKDKNGVVVALVNKVIYIKKKIPKQNQ